MFRSSTDIRRRIDIARPYLRPMHPRTMIPGSDLRSTKNVLRQREPRATDLPLEQLQIPRHGKRTFFPSDNMEQV